MCGYFYSAIRTIKILFFLKFKGVEMRYKDLVAFAINLHCLPVQCGVPGRMRNRFEVVFFKGAKVGVKNYQSNKF